MPLTGDVMHLRAALAPAGLLLALLVALLAAGPAAASEKLSTQGGCATCHAAAKKVIGPSWHDIAVKYKGQADAPALLAKRVREGSKGVWGTMPMAPTLEAKINDADLKTLIAWVLKSP